MTVRTFGRMWICRAWQGLAMLMLWVPLWSTAEPSQRYSYFSPGTGTVNFSNRDVEPNRFVLVGDALPEDSIVLTNASAKLLRLRGDGRVTWMLELKGGAAYGLGSYLGRLLVPYQRDVLVVNALTGEVESRLAMFDPSEEPINFLRVQGDRLIVGNSADRCRIVVAGLALDAEGAITTTAILHDIATRTQYPRDALFLDEHTLAVADTFGHAVVLLELRDSWKETRRRGEYYPNMLQLSQDGTLFVLSEHGNRITRWDLRTGDRSVEVSCPLPLFSDPFSSHRQIETEERSTASRETLPRQICAVDFAGNQTLYAANGFTLDGLHRIWVADADNHRVAMFVDGQFRGAVSNINHPVRVIPVSQL